MKKSIFIIIGGVVLAVLLAAGSFYGGMAYQRTQTNNVRNRFLASRGLNGTTNGFTNGGTGNGNFQGGFGRGAQGTIKSINGNTLTIATAQNDITVTLSGTTVIDKTSPASTTDLAQGDRVVVTGQRDSSGNMTATQILIEPATQTGQTQ